MATAIPLEPRALLALAVTAAGPRSPGDVRWFGWVVLKHMFIAAFQSSGAFISLCVTSYSIILSLFSLLNRRQACSGFVACSVRVAVQTLHPFGGPAGSDGACAACSPVVLFPMATSARLFSSFLFSFCIFIINYVFCHLKSCLIVSPGASAVPLWCSRNARGFCWVP